MQVRFLKNLIFISYPGTGEKQDRVFELRVIRNHYFYVFKFISVFLDKNSFIGLPPKRSFFSYFYDECTIMIQKWNMANIPNYITPQ